MATTEYSSPPIAGPAPLPIIGARGNFLLHFLRDPVAYMTRLYREYGPVVGMTANDRGAIFAFGPEYNRLLLSDADRFHIGGSLLFRAPEDSAPRRLNAGLTNMNGEKHRQQRRLMQPAFHRRQVETYRDDMVAVTQQLLDRWPVGQPLDIADQMQQVALHIANKTLLGIDTVAGTSNQDIGRMIKRWQTMILSPLVLALPLDLPGMPYRRAMRHAETMEQLFRRIIAEKRADLDAHRDVLAMLIQARDEDGGRMSDDELIGQLTLLFAAGHETSGNTMTWTLLLLAQHPEILADVVDELEQVLGGSPPTVEQLGQLPLLERAIKEVQRLFPVVFMSARKGTAPYQLGPYDLPAEMITIVSSYMTHRLPELYPEPLRFKPARWERIDPSPYEYLPFSAGARMCLGATFAAMEMKIALAMILQRFRLTIPPRTTVNRHATVTLSLKGSLPMLVLPQDRQFSRGELLGNIHEMVDLS